MWNYHVPCEHEICPFPIHSTTVFFIFHVQMNNGKLEIIKLGSGAIYKHQVSKPGFKFSNHMVTLAA